MARQATPAEQKEASDLLDAHHQASRRIGHVGTICSRCPFYTVDHGHGVRHWTLSTPAEVRKWISDYQQATGTDG